MNRHAQSATNLT